MPNLAGTSTHGVRRIPVGDSILLVGFAGRAGLHAMPAALRGEVRRVCDRLAHYPVAVEEVRHFLQARKCFPPEARLTDGQLVASLGQAIGRGEVEARVVPLARTHRSLGALAQARNVQRAVSAVAATASSAAQSRPGIAPGVGARTIGDLSLPERIAEIVRRAAARFPGAVGARLTAFAKPENIGLLAGGVLATGAGNGDRARWMADCTVAAIGFAYAGPDAFPVLGEVHAFATRAQNARSESDLVAAADALSRAVSILGIVGVAALLHRSAGEHVLGPGSVAGDLPDDAPKPEAATPATPVPPRTPTPAGELAAARAAVAKVKAAEEGLLAKAARELAMLRKQYADAIAKLRARADALLARARAEKAALEKRVAELKAEAEKEAAALEKKLAQEKAALEKEAAALKKKLADEEAALKKEEAALEKIAREAQAERKAIGERLKALQDQAKHAEAEARNLAKYGDKLGPTIDSLKKSGKSAEQIIKSAGRSGGKPLGL